MFVQVIRGKASDPQGLRQHLDAWTEKLAPGAEGWLGATSGIAADGEFITVARFESEEAARKNSDRPEQGEWYQQALQHMEGEPSFAEGTDVELILDGGSDDAGFVQVMDIRISDVAAYRELSKRMDELLPEQRPDLIGGISLYPGGNRVIQVAYFTSEEEARQVEAQRDSSDAPAELEQWRELMESVDYLDITDPMLESP